MASAGLILLIKNDGTALPTMAMNRAAPMPAISVLAPTDVFMFLSVSLLVRPNPRTPGPRIMEGELLDELELLDAGPPANVCVVLDELLFVTRVFVTGLAAAMPIMQPTTSPSAVSVIDSTTNWLIIFRFDAPMAFITPISRQRSRTIIIIVSRIMTAPATSAPIRLKSDMFLTLSSGCTAWLAESWLLVTSAVLPRVVFMALVALERLSSELTVAVAEVISPGWLESRCRVLSGITSPALPKVVLVSNIPATVIVAL